MVTWKFYSSRFTTPLKSQRVNGFQTLLKPARQPFLPIFLLILDKLSWEKSLLVSSWIFGPCFSKFTNYHMYSCKNWKKLVQQVQKHISSKLWPFYQYFIAFLESTCNFGILKEKMGFIAQLFRKLHPPKIVVTWKVYSSGFTTPLRSQSVYGFQTLLKLARQHFLPNVLIMLDKLS